MGMFGNVDIASANDSFGPPVGAYHMAVTSCEVKATKNDPEKFGLNLKFTIVDGPHQGYDYNKWLRVPAEEAPTDEKEYAQWERDRSTLKRWLMNMGIPESRLNDVDPTDVISLEVLGKTRTKKQPDEYSQTEIHFIEPWTKETEAKVNSVKSQMTSGHNPFGD